MGLLLTAAQEMKWKALWEVKITLTMIYRSLYRPVCLLKEGTRIPLQFPPDITERWHPSGLKANSVGVEKKACYDQWGGCWAKQRPRLDCLLPSCAPLAARTDFLYQRCWWTSWFWQWTCLRGKLCFFNGGGVWLWCMFVETINTNHFFLNCSVVSSRNKSKKYEQSGTVFSGLTTVFVYIFEF